MTVIMPTFFPQEPSEVLCRRPTTTEAAGRSSTRTRGHQSPPMTMLSRPHRLLALTLTFALLLAHVVQADAGGDDDDAPVEVKAIVGSSVNLPCDVDMSSCGEVHSVKVYKNGVRVYLLNLHSNVKRAEGDLAVSKNRAEFMLGNSPPALHVDPVYLIDEGLYKCEVTFVRVMEDCKTIAYSSLITLARPLPPEIRFDDGPMANMTRIGPFIEGTKLSLECKASGGKPVAQVTWWNGSDAMDSQYSEFPEAEETGRGVSTIDVTLDRTDLHSRFECRAMNDALDKPLVTWIDVDVHVRPLSIDILGVDGPVREGDQVTLTCVVMGARPAATVEWLNDTIEVSPAPITEVTEEEAGFTSTTRSAYTFMATRFDNGRRIRCRAKNSIMEERDEDPKEEVLILEVYYQPQVVMAPEGKMAVNHTETVELECRYDANPMNLTSVTWLRNGEVVAMTTDDENGDDDGLGDDEDDDDDDDDDDDVPRLVIGHVSHKHKGEYTCKLTNLIGFGFSSTSLVLDVNYPPVVEITVTPDAIPERDNANVTLECNMITSNPPELFGYMWLRDEKMIEETEENVYVLESVDRNDTANYSCKARNIYGWGGISEEEELLVQYEPGPSYITFSPPIVIKGHSATITCNTDDLGQPPAYQYRWYRNDIMQAGATESVLTIQPVTLAALSNFTCAPYNIIDEGPQAVVNIPLRAAPSFVQQLPETHGVLVNATEISLTCHVECFPICTPITWLKDGKQLQQSKYYSIKTDIFPLDYSTNTMDSVVSTLNWNLSSWPDGRLQRDSDNANYTCRSNSNVFGIPVSNTTYFRVEYPPEDISVSSAVVDVKEGLIPKKVVCQVSAYPLPTFLWTFDDEEGEDEIVSSEDTLRLKHRIERKHRGNYTCTASNRHGNASATTLINVMYMDNTCSIERTLTQDGRVVLTCTVDANPRVDFIWLYQNNTLGDDDDDNNDDYTIEQDDEVISTVTFREEPGLYGEYQCIAKNIIGTATPCFIEVTSEGGWLEQIKENKALLVAVAAIGAVAILILILIFIWIVRRRAAEKSGTAGEGKDGDDRAFYENLPFHGMQPPPNKPFKPILPDLEYADVDFPAKPLNNNNPPPYNTKAKIVEQVLEEVKDDHSPEKVPPTRPPRSREARK